MEAGYSCFAELGGDIGELGEIGEPACQQLGGFGDHLDLLSHEVLEAEAEDEDEDDRLISLDSGDSSSRQLQGGSQQGQLLPHRKTSRKQDTTLSRIRERSYPRLGSKPVPAPRTRPEVSYGAVFGTDFHRQCRRLRPHSERQKMWLR